MEPITESRWKIFNEPARISINVWPDFRLVGEFYTSMVRKDEAPPEFIPPEERIPRARPPPPGRGRSHWIERGRGGGRGRRGGPPRFEPYVPPRSTPRFEPFTSRGYASMNVPQAPALPQALNTASHGGNGNVVQRMIDEIPASATSISRDPRKRPEHLRKRSEGASATLVSSPHSAQPPIRQGMHNYGPHVPTSARSTSDSARPSANTPIQPNPPMSGVERQQAALAAVNRLRFTSAPAPIRVPASKPLPKPLATASASKLISKDPNLPGTPPAEPNGGGTADAFAPPSVPISSKGINKSLVASVENSRDMLIPGKNGNKAPPPVVTTVAFGAKVDNAPKKFQPFLAPSSNQNLPNNSNVVKSNAGQTQGTGTSTVTGNVGSSYSIQASKTKSGDGNSTRGSYSAKGNVLVQKSAGLSQRYVSGQLAAPPNSGMDRAIVPSSASISSPPTGRTPVPAKSFARSGAPFTKARQFLAPSTAPNPGQIPASASASALSELSQQKLQSPGSSKSSNVKTPTPLQKAAAEAKAKKARLEGNAKRSNPVKPTTNASNSSTVQPIVTTNMVQIQPPAQRVQDNLLPPVPTGRNPSAEMAARIERDRRLQLRRASLPSTPSSGQRYTQTRLSLPNASGAITPPPRRNNNPNLHLPRMVTTANVGRVMPGNTQRVPIAGLIPAQVQARSAPLNSGLTPAQVEAQAQARTLATKSEHARAALHAARAQQRPNSSSNVYTRNPNTTDTIVPRPNTTSPSPIQRNAKIVPNRPAAIHSGPIVRSTSLPTIQNGTVKLMGNQPIRPAPQPNPRLMPVPSASDPRPVTIVGRQATTVQTRNALGQSFGNNVTQIVRPPPIVAPLSASPHQLAPSSAPSGPTPNSTASPVPAPTVTPAAPVRRGRGRPKGSKTKNPSGRPRGRPKRTVSDPAVPTVTSIGTVTPPSSSPPIPSTANRAGTTEQEKRASEAENWKAMSFLAKRGKKRMLPSETESKPTDERPPTPKPPPQQSKQPSPKPVQKREPAAPKRQRVAHVLQSLAGPNVAPKKPRIQMLTLRPRNLAISIPPGALTASYLLKKTSTVGKTPGVNVPSKKRLGPPKYVSRGTAITPDLEQPEMRSDDLGLATRANVSHVARRPPQPHAPPVGKNQRGRAANNNLVTTMAIASSSARPVVQRNVPVATVKQTMAVRNIVQNPPPVAPKNIVPNPTTVARNIVQTAPRVASNVNQNQPVPLRTVVPPAAARPTTIPNSQPRNGSLPRPVTMRSGPQDSIVWQPVQKMVPLHLKRTGAPQAGHREMTIWKPVNRMNPSMPISHQAHPQLVRKENRIWKNGQNLMNDLAPTANRNVAQQPIPNKTLIQSPAQLVPPPMSNRLVAPPLPPNLPVSRPPPVSIGVPPLPVRKPIQKAKKNNMLKTAIQSLMVQQTEAQASSKKKSAPPPALTSAIVRNQILPVPMPPVSMPPMPMPPPLPVRKEKVHGTPIVTSDLAPPPENEIKPEIPPAPPKATKSKGYVREARPKGPVSTKDVRKAMDRVVNRKETGLSARKNTTPEYKAAATPPPPVVKQKFGCWCDEPVNQVPPHLLADVMAACGDGIAPLDMWRWRLVVHERICENASKVRDPKRAAMLRSFELQPFAMLQNRGGMQAGNEKLVTS